jgi:hypothetical protein
MMFAWEVYENTDYIDTVYFTDDCDENYIKNTLIDHDGYPSNIELQFIGEEGAVGTTTQLQIGV